MPFNTGITPELEEKLLGLLEYVEAYHRSTELWPTLAETASHFGVKRYRARSWIKKLEGQNRVVFVTPRSRVNGYVRSISG